MIQRLTLLFPVWVLLGSILAFYFPDWFVSLKPYIGWLLGLVMLGMGMTLKFDDFSAVSKRPGVIGLGVLLQYALMPFFAFAISAALGLDPLLTAGMVLVGASPGGTASNVVCYLARGDVALSITLTTISTLLAIVLTPTLSWLYLNHQVEVPVIDMLWSILKIVILPVLSGLFINQYFGRYLEPFRNVFPLVSLFTILIIIAIIVALNKGNLGAISMLLAIAVILHNALGLLAGYVVALWVTRCTRTARTIAIEVGMQNSGLAVALAVKYFASAAALPGAIFSFWHNITGPALAVLWRKTSS